MKKFFTAIALSGILMPVIYATQTNSFTDAQYYKQKAQINNLKALIRDADRKAFRLAFSESRPLSAEHIEELKKCVLKTKTAIKEELESMGDESINMPKLAKGVSATVAGGALAMSIPACLYTIGVIRNAIQENEIRNNWQMSSADKIPHTVVEAAVLRLMYETKTGIYLLYLLFSLPYDILNTFDFIGISNTPGGLLGIIAATSILYTYLSYKGIKYGYNNINESLNHTQYLLDKLADLDEIDAYIAQAKA